MFVKVVDVKGFEHNVNTRQIVDVIKAQNLYFVQFNGEGNDFNIPADEYNNLTAVLESMSTQQDSIADSLRQLADLANYWANIGKE